MGSVVRRCSTVLAVLAACSLCSFPWDRRPLAVAYIIIIIILVKYQAMQQRIGYTEKEHRNGPLARAFRSGLKQPFCCVLLCCLPAAAFTLHTCCENAAAQHDMHLSCVT